jgi:O-antigen/teichoic acid export membrane protein
LAQLLTRQLGKNTIVYGIGGIFSKSIGIILLPVYTRLFNPTEYGIIEQLTITGTLLSIVLNIGMDATQSHNFFEQQKQGKNFQAKLVTSILQWRIVSGFFIVLLAVGASPYFPAWLLGTKGNLVLFAAAFSGIWFFQIMNQSAEIFQLLYRPVPYLVLTIGYSLISASIIVGLTYWLKMGILGYFIGLCFASLVTAAIGWWLVREYIDGSGWHKDWWPKILRFGLPLVPAALAMYVMNTTDRWFIIHFHGKEALGIYSVGAKLSLGLLIVVEPFRKAWWPIAMDLIQNDGRPVIARIAQLYIGFGAVAAVLLTAFSPLFTNFLVAPVYYFAFPIVGILAWKTLFIGAYMIFSLGIWKQNKTKWVPLLHGIAAIVNILLNYVLVPKYSTLGAAIASSLTFLLWLLITLAASQMLWPVKFPFCKITFQLIGGLLATGILITSFVFEKYIIETIFLATILVFAIVRSTAKFNEYKGWFDILISKMHRTINSIE